MGSSRSRAPPKSTDSLDIFIEACIIKIILLHTSSVWFGGSLAVCLYIFIAITRRRLARSAPQALPPHFLLSWPGFSLHCATTVFVSWSQTTSLSFCAPHIYLSHTGSPTRTTIYTHIHSDLFPIIQSTPFLFSFSALLLVKV